jgi:hypothetical protein
MGERLIDVNYSFWPGTLIVTHQATMFEYDEDGKEWFGYTFSSEESDHAAVVSVFLGNVQYLEWFFRHIKNAPKRLTLAEHWITYLISCQMALNGP